MSPTRDLQVNVHIHTRRQIHLRVPGIKMKKNSSWDAYHTGVVCGLVQGHTLTQVIPHVPDPKADFFSHVPISRKKIINQEKDLQWKRVHIIK